MIAQDAKPPLDELAHYGIKGMKWGVRRGGLVSRFKGAMADRNQQQTAILTRARENRGASVGERLGRRIGVKLVGEKRYNKNLESNLKGLKDQRKRIESGKLKALDILEGLSTVTIGDLLISRRDNKG